MLTFTGGPLLMVGVREPRSFQIRGIWPRKEGLSCLWWEPETWRLLTPLCSTGPAPSSLRRAEISKCLLTCRGEKGIISFLVTTTS
jgi:hypothetical protein